MYTITKRKQTIWVVFLLRTNITYQVHLHQKRSNDVAHPADPQYFTRSLALCFWQRGVFLIFENKMFLLWQQVWSCGRQWLPSRFSPQRTEHADPPKPPHVPVVSPLDVLVKWTVEEVCAQTQGRGASGGLQQREGGEVEGWGWMVGRLRKWLPERKVSLICECNATAETSHGSPCSLLQSENQPGAAWRR